MGQAKKRGTQEERIALALAWDEAIREDRRRFPPPARPAPKGMGWLATAAMLALANVAASLRLMRRR